MYLDRFASIPIWPMFGVSHLSAQSAIQPVDFQSIASLVFILNVFVSSCPFFVFRAIFSLSLVGDPFIERSAWNSLLHWGSELNAVWERGYMMNKKRKESKRTEPNGTCRMNDERAKSIEQITWHTTTKKINERKNEQTAYFVSPQGDVRHHRVIKIKLNFDPNPD